MYICVAQDCKFSDENHQVVTEHCWISHSLRALPCHECKVMCRDIQYHHMRHHLGDTKCYFCEAVYTNYSSMYSHLHSFHRSLMGLTEPAEDGEPEEEMPLVDRMKSLCFGPYKHIIDKGNFVINFDDEEGVPIFGFESLTPTDVDIPYVFRNRPEYMERYPGLDLTEEAIKWLMYQCGHLVPCGDFYRTQEGFESTCCMENIVPFDGHLNTGSWRALEHFMRDLTMKCTRLNIFTIPIYDFERKTPEKSLGGVLVKTPVKLAKICFLEKPSEEMTSMVFIMENITRKFTSGIFHFRSTLDELKRISGLHFKRVPLTWEANKDRPFFRCTKCSLTYWTEEALEEHNERIHEGRYRCQRCSLVFPSLEEVNAHHQSHPLIKCAYCDETFFKESMKNRHERTHTKEKPFACDWPGCDKAYFRNDHLILHKRKHTKDLPYECDWEGCKKAFPNGQDLKRHRMSHTGEKPYKCKYCKYATNDVGSLKKHVVKMHPTETYEPPSKKPRKFESAKEI